MGAPLSIHIYLGIVQIFALAGKRNSHSTVENTIIKAWRGHPLVGWERHPLHFLKVLKEITSLKWTSFRPDDTTMAQTGYGRDIWSKASHNLTTVFFRKQHSVLCPRIVDQALVKQLRQQGWRKTHRDLKLIVQPLWKLKAFVKQNAGYTKHHDQHPGKRVSDSSGIVLSLCICCCITDVPMTIVSLSICNNTGQ